MAMEAAAAVVVCQSSGRNTVAPTTGLRAGQIGRGTTTN